MFLSKLFNRIAHISALTLLLYLNAVAQPQICGPDPDMTSFCIDACVICDIDGYTGINSDQAQGEAPPDFCTTQVHHMQWIAFIAGSVNLTLTVKATNCIFNQGLEVGIYQSLDCETFLKVSNCDTDIQENETATFTNTVPLVIGQYYYFVMDGSADDVCNYTIQVISGSTMVPPLPPTEPISGPQETCLFETETYYLPLQTGATFYRWQVDGQDVGFGTELPVTWNNPGIHTICATAFNVCDTAAPFCMTVRVFPPDITNLAPGICEGDLFEVADTLLGLAGNYSFLLKNIHGCDSTVNVLVSILPSVNSSVTATICSTDSLYVGDTWYHPPGNYTELQTSYNGCDSLIGLTLNAIICEMTGNTTTVPVQCKGFNNGQLLFQVLDGTPPFTYSWKRINGTPSGTGTLNATSSPVTLGNLPPGTYIITVNDGFGNDVILSGVVEEPAPLELGWQKSEFNGYQVSCAGSTNGSLTSLVQGGNPPYFYQWANGSTTSGLTNIPAGNYSLTLTDSKGCTLLQATSLTEPDPLEFEVVYTNPGCDGYNTGLVQVQMAKGGVPSYEFSVNNSAFSTDMTYPDLVQGDYLVAIRDANGCIADTTEFLLAAEIPVLNVGPDLTVMLGCTEQIQPQLNVFATSIQWTPAVGLSCTDCLEPQAGPYTSQTYVLAVSSKDGCTTSDSLRVMVDPVREVYFPNVFAPDQNGVNDHFTVFGGKAVRQVKSLQVWSRWGELVYEKNDFPVNILSSGWDGSFRGKPLNSGVYTWVAEIDYLDGVVEQFQGDVTLVR